MKYPYVVERILDHYPELDPEVIVRRIRRGSFVSTKKRYLYFEVPKAACTQMKELLRTLEGGPPVKLLAGRTWQTRREMFVHARSSVPLPSLVDLDDRTQREVLESPDFFRMTIVRNPYKRLISSYRNRVLLCEPGAEEVYLHVKGGLPGIRNKSLVSFKEFIDYVESCNLRTCNVHWSRQVDHVFFPVLNFSYVGKVEQFGEALGRFGQHLGLADPLVADKRNVSFPVGFASYSQDLAGRVYSLYREDFETLGYDPDSWTAFVDRGGEKSAVPVEIFYDEVIERNLVIQSLYEERERLRTLTHRLSRLHLLPAINGLIACGSAWRRLAYGVRERANGKSWAAARRKRGSVTSA